MTSSSQAGLGVDGEIMESIYDDDEYQERELARRNGMSAFEASNYTPVELQEKLMKRVSDEPVYDPDIYEPAPVIGASGFYESIERDGSIQYTTTPPLRLTKEYRARLEAIKQVK